MRGDFLCVPLSGSFQESEALYDSGILCLALADLEKRDDLKDEYDRETDGAGEPSEYRDDESDAAECRNR